MSQFIKFKAGNNLIKLAIEAQNGSSTTAITELISNSSDGKASEIHVLLTEKRVVVRDNGVGFKDKQDFINKFEYFGEGAEREGVSEHIGRFHIGRGQIMDFGRVEWRTSTISAATDYESAGQNIGFDLKDGLPPIEGCAVTCQFYKPLTGHQVSRALEDLKQMVAFMHAKVYINGTLASTDPNKTEWEYEDDYCQFSKKDMGGIEVYSNGVYVKTINTRHYGFSGTFNAKKRLKLNIARNETSDTCPIWLHMLSVLEKRSEDIANEDVSKGQTKESTTKAVIASLKREDPHRTAQTAKLFTCANNKRHSINSLLAGDVGITGDINSIADYPAESENITSKGEYIVLKPSVYKNFGVSSALEIVTHINRVLERANSSKRLKHTDFDTAMEDIESSKITYEEKQLSDYEWNLIYALSDGMHDVLVQSNEHQKDNNLRYAKGYYGRGIFIGHSTDSSVLAWTDGHSKIVLNRNYAKGIMKSQQALEGGILTIIHELAHTDETEAHDHDFYKYFHDLLMMDDKTVPTAFITKLVEKVAATYVKRCERTLAKYPVWLDGYSSGTRGSLLLTSPLSEAQKDTISLFGITVKTSGATKAEILIPANHVEPSATACNAVVKKHHPDAEPPFLLGEAKAIQMKRMLLSGYETKWQVNQKLRKDGVEAFHEVMGFPMSELFTSYGLDRSRSHVFWQGELFGRLFCELFDNVIGFSFQDKRHIACVGGSGFSALTGESMGRTVKGVEENIANVAASAEKSAEFLTERIKHLLETCDEDTREVMRRQLNHPDFIESLLG